MKIIRNGVLFIGVNSIGFMIYYYNYPYSNKQNKYNYYL